MKQINRKSFRLRPAHLLWLAVPFLLWWALRDIAPADILAALARLRLWQVAALIVINALIFATFSARWWLLLRAQGYPVSFFHMTRYRVASFGVSYFTPGAQVGGEPLQAYLLQRNHHVPAPAAIAATALDKIIDLIANFAFVVVGLFLINQRRIFPGLTALDRLGFWAMLIALVTLSAFLLAAVLDRYPLSGLLQRLPQRFKDSRRYARVYQPIRDSEQRVSRMFRDQPFMLFWALLLTALNWGLVLTEYWLTMDFLGLSLTWLQLITALTVNRIALMALVPGGLGALESGQVLTMTAFGFNPAIGITHSLIGRARDIATGGLGLWWGGRAATASRMQTDDDAN